MMLTTISSQTLDRRQPWGLGNVTSGLEVARSRLLSIWSFEQTWMALSVLLDTSIIALIEHQKVEQTSSLVAEIESLLSQLQELGVGLGAQEEIREYLLKFPDLIEVIPLAINAARVHLPEAQLFLEVYKDPEIEDQYLMLYVRVQNYDESVIERIEAAESDYIDLLIGKEGWLQMSTDFRQPESV